MLRAKVESVRIRSGWQAALSQLDKQQSCSDSISQSRPEPNVPEDSMGYDDASDGCRIKREVSQSFCVITVVTSVFTLELSSRHFER